MSEHIVNVPSHSADYVTDSNKSVLSPTSKELHAGSSGKVTAFLDPMTSLLCNVHVERRLVFVKYPHRLPAVFIIQAPFPT